MKISHPILTAVVIAVGTSATLAENPEDFRNWNIDLDGYGCKPCVRMGYLEAYKREHKIFRRLESAFEGAVRERNKTKANLFAREHGERGFKKEIGSYSGLLERLDSELASWEQREVEKGFDEIALLEKAKAQRKLMKREKKRLQNLRKKRYDFRDRHGIAKKIRRRDNYRTRIRALEAQLAKIDELPPAKELRRLLAQQNAEVSRREAKMNEALGSYLVAKRELIFCTSHFELRRSLSHRHVEHDVPFIEGD